MNTSLVPISTSSSTRKLRQPANVQKRFVKPSRSERPFAVARLACSSAHPASYSRHWACGLCTDAVNFRYAPPMTGNSQIADSTPGFNSQARFEIASMLNMHRVPKRCAAAALAGFRRASSLQFKNGLPLDPNRATGGGGITQARGDADPEDLGLAGTAISTCCTAAMGSRSRRALCDISSMGGGGGRHPSTRSTPASRTCQHCQRQHLGRHPQGLTRTLL